MRFALIRFVTVLVVFLCAGAAAQDKKLIIGYTAGEPNCTTGTP